MVERVSRILAGAGAAVLSALIGCGGGGGGASNLNLSNVKLDSGAARSAVITPEGGSLSVTGSNGVIYTLKVPEGALRLGTEIGMIPITEITPLAGAGPLAAGVHFTPEGLEFLFGAELAMQLPAGMDPKQLLPIGYQGDAQDPHVELMRIQGQTVTMSVQHFSGKALAGRTLEELLQTPVDTLDEKFYQFQMMKAYYDFLQGTIDQFQARVRMFGTLDNWYAQIVRLRLDDGMQPTSNFDAIWRGIKAYDAWLDGWLFGEVALLDSDFQNHILLRDSEQHAVSLLRRTYQFYNDACRANPEGNLNSIDYTENPLMASADALSVKHIVRDWHIPAQPNQLHDEFLLDNLCAKVVIESIQGPPGFGPGEAGILQVRAGYTIADGAVRRDPRIKISFQNGTTFTGITPTSGPTDAQGNFRTDIFWPAAAPTATAKVLACINHSAPVIRQICRFDQRTFSGGGGNTPKTITPAQTAVRVNRDVTFTSADPNATFSISGQPQGATITSGGVFRSSITGQFTIVASNPQNPAPNGLAVVQVTFGPPYTVAAVRFVNGVSQGSWRGFPASHTFRFDELNRPWIDILLDDDSPVTPLVTPFLIDTLSDNSFTVGEFSGGVAFDPVAGGTLTFNLGEGGTYTAPLRPLFDNP